MAAIYESKMPWSPDRPRTLAVLCSDGRWRYHIEEFIATHLGAGAPVDVVAVPGGIEPLTLADLCPKDFSFLRRRMEMLVDAHALKRVIAVGHQDCAWYRARTMGPRLDPHERQIADLRGAAAWLRGTYPELRVETYLARLGSTSQRVAFEVVP